jgi:hypothetical protein
MALVGCLLFFAGPISVAAQCAYPALELLEFDYVNSRHTCLTAARQHANSRREQTTDIEYEFEGRLLVIDTLLRWLDLDATAEAWTSLPSSRRSE